MARKNPKIGKPITVQGGGFITPSLGQIGAPVGIGSNARAMANALKGFNATLGSLAKEQVQKQDIQDRLRAEEEFITAKREGTLEGLRKATIDGSLPEGASPAYNDFRKTLLAKDAIQNIYATELNSNLDALVDPDITPQDKALLLQSAYQKAGIGDLNITDPVSRGMVNKMMLGIQTNLDKKSADRYVELNKQKMDEAIGQDAVNALTSYDGDPEMLRQGFIDSINIAKKGSVKEPTKKVASAYLQQISNVALENPDRAQELLDTLVDAKFDDGTQVMGNLDLITAASRMENDIENAIIREERQADQLLGVQLNKVSQSIESTIPEEIANDPEAIKRTYDEFLAKQRQLQPSERLPRKVIDGIQKERNARMKEALSTNTFNDDFALTKLNNRKRRIKLYSNMAHDATSEEDYKTILRDIDSRDDINAREKADIKKSVRIVKSVSEISTASYNDNVSSEDLASIGLSSEATQGINTQLNIDLNEVTESSSTISRGVERVFNSTFAETLSEIAQDSGMSYEEVLHMTKSPRVGQGAGLPAALDSSNNFVKQASSIAKKAALQYGKQQMNDLVSGYKLRAKYMLEGADIIVDNLTRQEVSNISAIAMDESKPALERVNARELLVTSRSELIRLGKAIGQAKDEEGESRFLSVPSILGKAEYENKYYKIQNALGYSLKEILQGETLSGVSIDTKRINPTEVKIVWNKRELKVLKKMSDEDKAKVASLFGFEDPEDLIKAQSKLLK
jgi:hypothetical protein